MKIKSLNNGWNFCLGDEFDEALKENVSIPHAVRLEPEISSGCRNYQGKCIYRKNLHISKEMAGEKLILEFEGAMGASTLFINGMLVKEHFCGYTPLIVDATEVLRVGYNDIEVRLDNSDSPDFPPGKPQDVLDFNYDGGLYRNARLISHSKLYITNPILANEVAGGGIYVWYSDVCEESAILHIRTQIRNEYPEDKSFELVHRIVDNSGATVAESKESAKLSTDSSEYFETQIVVKKPKLWSPETPNLYDVVSSIEIDGKEVFIKHTEIGIRTFKFTVGDGVIFNGVSRRFNGGNYHHTWPYIGNAMSDNMLERDIRKIKSMGMDNIRSHYPFSTSFLSACNRLGMTIVVSNPGWQFCEPGIFTERMLQNLQDVIRWQRNNPCILFWEPILNESKIDITVQQKLHDIVHEEYPYGDCYTASDWGPTDIAYKDYDPGMLGKGLEDYGLVERDDSVERPRWIREYGDSPDDFFNQNTIWRCKRSWGDFAMNEAVNRMLCRYDASGKSGQYLNMYNNKDICGYGVWPAIAHNRGYHINPCWGGHLDIFRVPKFSYYFMRSQQDASVIGDFVYIANWWGEMSPVDVTVYSNAERVQLFVNDTLVAEQEPDEVAVKHPPFTFANVKRNYHTRERTKLVAKALVNGEVVAVHTVNAPGVAVKMQLEVDFENVPLAADGADTVAVRCYMTDAYGSVVPFTADVHPILFEIEGEGSIVGDSKIGANPICAEAGVATILVRSTENAGEIKVRAKMLWEQNMQYAIKPAEISFTTV